MSHKVKNNFQNNQIPTLHHRAFLLALSIYISRKNVTLVNPLIGDG